VDIQINEVPPTPEEYCLLRSKCGLGVRTVDAAKLALPRSLYALSLRDTKHNLVGMGRIVGDLGSHVQIVDIAVEPAFQKRGLSRVIMDRLMAFVAAEVPSCAYVNLFADVDYLYQKYGFEYAVSKGMSLNRDKIPRAAKKTGFTFDVEGKA
jgi:ribosomal protein S18 acetylase RimI-like enzyme